jgi:hypothetical protein
MTCTSTHTGGASVPRPARPTLTSTPVPMRWAAASAVALPGMPWQGWAILLVLAVLALLASGVGRRG